MTNFQNGAFFALSVADMDNMIGWYTEQLGFKVDDLGGNEVRKGALLSKPGILLELAQFHEAKSREDGESHEIHGIFKIGFLVDDVEATFQNVQEKSLTIFFPLVQANAGLRTFGIQDPEGNILQFFGR